MAEERVVEEAIKLVMNCIFKNNPMLDAFLACNVREKHSDFIQIHLHMAFFHHHTIGGGMLRVDACRPICFPTPSTYCTGGVSPWTNHYLLINSIFIAILL